MVRKLRAAGHTALFAGGCVRDLLLGRAAKDFDVATTARPEQVRSLFGQKRTLAVGASFGVIIVLGPRDAGQVEVATFRTEGPYHDGRHPASVAFSTPEDDARRRDFTINGMFYDPIDGRVLDFVGGEDDLVKKVIRAIGDPLERMTEDKLRMLRAVRFAATLDFELEAVTASAVRDMATQLVVVSAERIAQELKKMLLDDRRRRAVELAEHVALRSVILPELDPHARDPVEYDRTLRMLELLQKPAFELALAAWLHFLPEAVVYDICRRLKLSNDECDRTTWLVRHQLDLADAHLQPLARLKRTLAHADRDNLIGLLRVRLLASGSDLRPVLFCDEYLSRTPQTVINPAPLISGDDLKSLGLAPGPAFKSLLDAIRDAQLNDQISTREQAIELARGLASGG